MLKFRSADPVTWRGRFRPSLSDAEINLRATAELPVWAAVGGTHASAEQARRLGRPIVLGLNGATPSITPNT